MPYNSQIILGRYPGQSKVVTKQSLSHKTNSFHTAEGGVNHFMATGLKFGKKFIPHHLDGPLKVCGTVRVFKDDCGLKYNEILADSTAEYAGPVIQRSAKCTKTRKRTYKESRGKYFP